MNISNKSLPPPDPQPPYGFELIDGPNQHKVLVPTFMVPATKLALEKRRTRINMKVDEACPGPRPLRETPYQGIAEGKVHFPPDPELCEREALNLHSEVKALQATLGISYKDAAHRLYMAEVEKMQIENDTNTEFTYLRMRIDDILENHIYPPIDMIDKGVFEDKD